MCYVLDGAKCVIEEFHSSQVPTLRFGLSDVIDPLDLFISRPE